MPLEIIEAAFEKVGYSKAEMECVVSYLLTHGGMKGYITIAHNKLVLPLDTMFPPIEKFYEQMD
jgi:hypothetical protein